MVVAGALRTGVADGRRTGALHVLLAGLSLVVALIVAYALHFKAAPLFVDARWDADVDRSHIEVLGYAFVLGAAALLLGLFLRRDAPVYAGWSAGMLILLADDLLALHERAGSWLEGASPDLDPPLLRAVDLGELAFWAVTTTAMGLVLYGTHRRSCRSAQQHSYHLAALVALLVVFAVGVDMLHIAVKSLLDSERVNFLLISVEAAGEAGVMAGLVAYAMHITRRPAGT